MVVQSDPLSRLQQWLCPSFTNVRITSKSATNRILTCLQDTPSNTTLLRILTTHTITTNSALQDPLIHKILSTHPPPEPTTAESAALLLRILLLSVCDDYKPWFDALPKRIDTATTVSSIMPLLNTPLYPLAEKLRQELHALYQDWYIPITQTYETDFPPLLRNKHKFLYAHAILESRAFQYNNQTTITPLLDFCNHSTNPNTMIMFTDSEITLRSICPISMNTELKICYGRLSNQDLLLHWGFAVEENAFDEILLSLEYPDNVSKMLVLACCVDSLEFCLCVDDPLPEELLKVVRIFGLGETELVDAVRRDYSRVVSRECEIGALRMLREIVDGLDIECLEDGEGGEFRRFCGVYRNGIMKILDLTKAKIQDLEKTLDTLE